MIAGVSLACMLSVMSSMSSFLAFVLAEQSHIASLVASLVAFCVGFACFTGLFQSFVARMISPAPDNHTVITTSGIRHTIEPSGSGIGGGGEHVMRRFPCPASAFLTSFSAVT